MLSRLFHLTRYRSSLKSPESVRQRKTNTLLWCLISLYHLWIGMQHGPNLHQRSQTVKATRTMVKKLVKPNILLYISSSHLCVNKKISSKSKVIMNQWCRRQLWTAATLTMITTRLECHSLEMRLKRLKNKLLTTWWFTFNNEIINIFIRNQLGSTAGTY